MLDIDKHLDFISKVLPDLLVYQWRTHFLKDLYVGIKLHGN